MTTIRQLAKIAGVSIGTISKALHGDTRVAAATRERVQALAEQYHYYPNRLMQSLVSGKSQTIGCVFGHISHPPFTLALCSVMERATTEQYHVISFQTLCNPTTSKHAIEALIEQRVEGVLLSPAQVQPIPRATLLALWSHDIIPIGLGYLLSEVEFDRVTFSEEGIAETTVEYLTSLGHRRIAYLGTYAPQACTMEAAMRRSFEKRKLGTDLIIYFNPEWREFDMDIFSTIIDCENPATAVITFDEHIAVKTIQLAHRRGLRVPEDISVLGGSNSQGSSMFWPSLTVIDERWDEIGRLGVDLLFERLANGVEEARTHPKLITVPPILIERETCAPPNRHGYTPLPLDAEGKRIIRQPGGIASKLGWREK